MSSPAPALLRASTEALFKRVAFKEPNKAGLICGSDVRHVRRARRWAVQAARCGPGAAQVLVACLSELHTNALRHSASGFDGGRVRIEIERRRLIFVVAVTDDGPRVDAPFTVPHLHTPDADIGPPLIGEYGCGLRLVDRLALYWDWTGVPGGPLTVRAVVSRQGRSRTEDA